MPRVFHLSTHPSSVGEADVLGAGVGGLEAGPPGSPCRTRGGRRRRTGRRCCEGSKASRLGPLGNTLICWMAHKIWLAAHPDPGVGHASSQELSQSETACSSGSRNRPVCRWSPRVGRRTVAMTLESPVTAGRWTAAGQRAQGRARGRRIPPRTTAAVAEVGLRYLARLSRCTHVSPVRDGRTWTADRLEPYKTVARGCQVEEGRDRPAARVEGLLRCLSSR